MRILLVEPDRVLANIYRQAFDEAGISVELAYTAQQAIVSLDSQLVDLIVVELQIAHHNGVEFIHELRSYPEWQYIPVVLHTLVVPSSLKMTPQTMQTLGIKQYLYKPTTSLEKLITTVERSVPLKT